MNNDERQQNNAKLPERREIIKVLAGALGAGLLALDDNVIASHNVSA